MIARPNSLGFSMIVKLYQTKKYFKIFFIYLIFFLFKKLILTCCGMSVNLLMLLCLLFFLIV